MVVLFDVFDGGGLLDVGCCRLFMSSTLCLCFDSYISWLGPNVGRDDHRIEAAGNPCICQCVACLLIVDDLASIFVLLP